VDAVGYQAVDKGGQKEKPNVVLDNLIRVTRPCGEFDHSIIIVEHVFCR
jgi:hypothetical protein